MKIDERLSIIYETMVVAITKTDRSWQSFLDFGSKIYKYPFDNALLLYSQNPNVTTLATRPIWNKVGRYVNRGEKGIAVFEYKNAKATFRYLFDIKQTNGQELADRWELNETNEDLLVEKFNSNDDNIKIENIIESLILESLEKNFDSYLVGIEEDLKNHPLEKVDLKAIKETLQEVFEKSSLYFVNQRCGIYQDELYLPIIEHFDSIPLVARIGYAVTETSKDVLLQIEKQMKIIEKERIENYERTRLSERQGITSTYQSTSRGSTAGRTDTTREVWANGNGEPTREQPTEIYESKNARQVDDNDVGNRGRSQSNDGENSSRDVVERPNATDGGHNGENTSPQQDTSSSRGDSSERHNPSTEIEEKQQQYIAENMSIFDNEELPNSNGNSFLVEETVNKEVEKQKPMGNTLEHRLYNEVEKQFPQIINKSYKYIKLKSKSGVFMDLYVERIDRDKIAIAHTFEQNGDSARTPDQFHDSGTSRVMFDPEIVFRVNDDERTITSETFEQTGFMFQDVYSTDTPSLTLQRDINDFLEDWLNNISQQGYIYTNAIAVIKGEDVDIKFEDSSDKINELLNDSKNEIADSETKENELYVGQVIRYLDKEMQVDNINIDSDTIELLDLSTSYPIYGVFNLSNVLDNYEKIVNEQIVEETESIVQTEENLSDEVRMELLKNQKFTSDDLKTINESVDAHNGQVDMLLGVYEKDAQSGIGYISYSIYENEIHIQNIEVADIHKRKGLGTYLLQDLADRYYGYDFKFGYATEEGSLFLEAVTEKEPNQYYEDQKTLLELLKIDIQEMDNKYAENEAYTEQEVEIYYENIDKVRELEHELANLSPYFLVVRDDIDPFNKDVIENQDEEDIVNDDLQDLTLEDIERVNEENIEVVENIKLNYQYSEADNLYVGGDKTRFKANVEAIKLVNALEQEGRLATVDEQKILAKYVGWGGLANAFSSTASGWENEYQELKLLLDEDEYKDAMTSTITAYYTEQKVIEQIYKGLESFGFKGEKGRKILDPAMGTGNFYSVLPQNFSESNLYGVELDSTTGRIAKQLYQNANIEIKGFESTNFDDNTFDVAIGNIPFNNIKIHDKRYEKEDFLIHDYFIAKSIDLVKKGGIIAYITSKGTMDKQDSSVREYIAKRADLIGAIRLPNTAFKAIAGTEVTTDILFLQKRDIELLDFEEMPDWVETEFNADNRFTYNKYFIDNPQMVLGDLVASSRMYGRSDLACELPKDRDLYEELEYAISQLKGNFKAEITKEVVKNFQEENQEEVETIKAPNGVKNMTYHVQDNKIYYCEKGRLHLQNIEGKKAERIKGLCEVKVALVEVIDIQSQEWGYEETTLNKAQIELNKVYDNFVKKNGFINTKANTTAFSEDDQLSLLCSIEDSTEDEHVFTKAPIFTKATIKSYKVPTSVETVQEALELSLNFKQGVDLEYMSNLYNKSEDEIIEELGDKIFLNPSKYYGNYHKGWEIRDEYLSGDVFSKLEYAVLKAHQNEIFERNVTALEQVQPEWLQPSDIYFNVGSTWIPIEVYQDFMYEAFETPNYVRSSVLINFSEYTTNWNISRKSYDNNMNVTQTYGTKRINGYEILEQSLNNQIVTIRDKVTYYKDGEEREKYVVNANETMLARSKQQALKEKFKNWLFSDSERSEILLKIYNERFNTIRPREYDGSHLIFPNMSTEWELRQHQKDVVARIVYNGNCLMAHEVGAGKTAAMLAAGMYMKSVGATQKPIYVVPNHLTGQWANELLRFFPTANVLTTTKKDFEKSNRKKFVGKIAMGDYDAIIIGHSQFEKIPISKEREIAQIEKEISRISVGILEAKSKAGENWSVKQMVIFEKNLQERLKRLNKEERKDNILDFEQLGVDYMFVDEAHVYKNLHTYTKLRNVAGIGKSASQRANDMLLKCRYLQEVNNGRGITFATGTPISNSMSEMYVMQRYLQPQLLNKMGFSYFDAWAAHFGEITSSLEIKPEGSGYQIKNRFAKFNNLPELMNMFKEVADIKTAEMLNLPVPALETGKVQIVVSELTDVQKEIMDSFVIRAEDIRAKRVDSQTDNMLKLTNEAKLMAIDPRLLDETIEDCVDSKLNMCIDKTFEIWERTMDNKSTQVIFCDSGTPRPDKFNVYDEIRNKLVAKGIDEKEIAFIHEANTETQKEDMFKKVRSGDIRVLLGSTGKLGTGTNVQSKLIAMHHIDVPWRPSDVTQRDGRGIRQGNENKEVAIFRYVTKGSFDSYLWQIQEQKLKYISQVMTAKNISRSMEDVDETVLSAAEVKAIATSNPLLSEKMEVDNEVTRLKLLKGAWLDEKTINERNINEVYPEKIKILEGLIIQGEKDVNVAKLHEKDDFKINIDGYIYDERVKAGDDLFKVIRAKCTIGGEPKLIGEFKTFEMYVQYKRLDDIEVMLKGNIIYKAELGTSERGAITRIENLMSKPQVELDDVKNRLESYNKNLEIAKKSVLIPFMEEEKLQTALNRQLEINTALEFSSLGDDVIDEGGEENEQSAEVRNDERLEMA